MGHGTEPKQLAQHAASLLRPSATIPTPSDADLDGEPTLALEIVAARFSALADADLDGALDSSDPATRLAACWRVMVREQALRNTPPDDGLRLLLSINLASTQDLRSLEVAAALDPCPTVRAAALTSMWRVARDRDRVLAFVLSRLGAERSEAPLLALFELTPPLPMGLATAALAPQLASRSLEVRVRAVRAWLAHDQDDATLLAAVAGEPDAAVRLAVIDSVQRAGHDARLLRWAADPGLRHDVLQAFAHARRELPFAAVAHLLDDDDDCDAVLERVVGPYDDDARARLLALTGVDEPGATLRASPTLLRCIRDAHAEVMPTAATRARVAAWRSRREETFARMVETFGADAVRWYEDRWFEDDAPAREQVQPWIDQVWAIDELIDAVAPDDREHA